MAGSAIPTTVASIAAMADPRTVANRTHRPAGLANLSAGSWPGGGVIGPVWRIAAVPVPDRTPAGPPGKARRPATATVLVRVVSDGHAGRRKGRRCSDESHITRLSRSAQ